MGGLRAALWVPDGHAETMAVLATVATSRGWDVRHVIHHWQGWLSLVREGRADIGLMPHRGVLPADRTPRLVTPDQLVSSARRRPQRLR